MKKEINIGLLSHLFCDSNYGCVAISLASIYLLEHISDEMNVRFKYIICVNEKMKQVRIDNIEGKYEYRVYLSTKEALKHPFKWRMQKLFDDCDIVIDLCDGDGFSDIYGFSRVVSESYMAILAILKRKTMILGPQTIGPYKFFASRMIAKWVINRCEKVFVRDSLSQECCGLLTGGHNVVSVSDLAFQLPFACKKEVTDKIKIGINISGLLYKSNYHSNNDFDLNIDYKMFIEKLICSLLEKEHYEIHLIPHVISDGMLDEDDYVACKKVYSLFKDRVVLAPKFTGPIEAKNYISAMDYFTGARMHSTIAAFSSMVPVIPMSYSRKFNGVYSESGYPYIIDMKKEKSIENAIAKFYEFTSMDRMVIISLMDDIMKQYNRLNDIYMNEIKNIISIVE